MNFASPLWLLALVPWAALAVWMLIGMSRGADVPFVKLWHGTAAPKRERFAIHPPPPAVVLMLAAVLVAILAAAKPQILSSNPITAQPRAAENISIVNVAARQSPRPQLMVRVRNDSSVFDEATLVVDASVAQNIELPPRGTEQNYFVNVDQLAATTNVWLANRDDVADDNHASLTRKQSWPVIEPRGPLPPAVSRMIETYMRIRPADENSRIVVVASGSSPPDIPAVVITAAGQPADVSALHVADHPVSVVVNWKDLPADAAVADAPGTGWTPVVSAGAKPIVAVRDDPTRQVWIGFTSETWPRSSDFVIFWTNVLDWAGRGGEHFEAHLFQRPEPLSVSVSNQPPAATNISAPLLVGALALILAAGVVWALQ